jgi:protein ImuB
MILCVQLDAAPAGDVLDALLTSAPRVALEAEWAWLDGRGLDVRQLHAAVRHRLEAAGRPARFGAALRPVVAQVAARASTASPLVVVEPGAERAFLATQLLAELGLEDPLLGWLADVGIVTCGELAAVAREAVEVRFGGAAVHWWKLARGDDERRLFAPVPPEQPHASVDFVDYVVTDPERLIFTTNALLGGLCEQMRERGTHARRLRLRLPLANGTVWERTLKTARPTADRAAWLRLARLLLEKLTVPDAVSGVAVHVAATEAAAAVQGDLFDAGFATSSAVETAVARLLEDQGDVAVQPATSRHPLVELRGEYRALTMREVLQLTGDAARDRIGSGDPPANPGTRGAGSAAAAPLAAEPVGLTLQLLSEPRAVVVESVQRRDHAMPVRYRDRRWHALVHAAGPDRVSGGHWDASYAREYFRAVTATGTLVWLFRDAARDRWYLHGWWD